MPAIVLNQPDLRRGEQLRFSRRFAESRSDDREARKVGAIAACVSGQQAQTGNGRVSTDVEVRKRRPLCSAPSPVGEEGLARQKSCFPREWEALEVSLGENLVELLDRVEPDRHL